MKIAIQDVIDQDGASFIMVPLEQAKAMNAQVDQMEVAAMAERLAGHAIQAGVFLIGDPRNPVPASIGAKAVSVAKAILIQSQEE